MIRSFRNQALRNFWEKDDARGIRPNWVKRVAVILDRLDAATVPGDMNLPGLRFHPSKGDEKGRYQVDLTAAWRITFGWQDNDAVNVDMLEDH